jgi:hypothetical protein
MQCRKIHDMRTIDSHQVLGFIQTEPTTIQLKELNLLKTTTSTTFSVLIPLSFSSTDIGELLNEGH